MSSVTLKRIKNWSLPMGVLSASITPDAKSLIAGCMDGVYELNLQTGDSRLLYSHQSYVSSVSYLIDQELVVSAGYDGRLIWHELPDGRKRNETKVHDFWSWDMATSPNQKWIASATGQYLAGGYKYEPQPESEPSVKIMNLQSGSVIHELSHVPSVQAVAFSNDSKLVAAGNLMGEIRVWDVDSGQQVATWTTPDFTSWGIIKSHCYLGGVFAMRFSPDDQSVLLAGMGQMRDPMAGNGKQLWQRWKIDHAAKTATKQSEINKSEAGEGLMETLAIHPDGKRFVMGGRLRGGDWNVAMFDLENGSRLGKHKSGYRITEANFSADGSRLVLAGAKGQSKREKDGTFKDFGKVEVYQIA